MCFKGPKQPDPPPPINPPPPLRTPAPPRDVPRPEQIKEELGEDELVSGKKRTALQIAKIRRGMKEFGALTPGSIPSAPESGITPPT
tara:strand:- start:3279 stop:3539 length:261 start_codon:yes stop_codon:yes gene_type:complete